MMSGGPPSDIDPSDFTRLVEKRADFLTCLLDGPLSRRDICDRLDHSKSTVKRATAELVEHGLVEEESRNAYVTTAAGRIALVEHREVVDRATDIRDSRSALRPLSSSPELDPAIAVGADITLVGDDHKFSVLEPVRADIERGDSLQVLYPYLPDSRDLDLLQSRSENDTVQIELLVDTSLQDVLSDEFEPIFDALSSASETAVYGGPVPEFGLVIAEDDDVATVSMLVFSPEGSLHALIRNGTTEAVAWARQQFESARDRAELLTSPEDNSTPDPTSSETDSLAHSSGQQNPRSVSASTTVEAHNSDDTTRVDLPLHLEEEGFVSLSPSYFDHRNATSPSTAIRTGIGLPEVAAGYAVDRTRPTERGRERLDETILNQLSAGEDTVVLGPAGAGKSTLCRSLAYRWYEEGCGPVLYRESGHRNRFESVARLRATLRETDAHALVVVEDAIRPDANPVFELVRDFDGDDTVTFLLDARRQEWEDPPEPLSDARLDAHRVDALVPVHMPEFDHTECQRVLNHCETLLNEEIPLDAYRLCSADEPDESQSAGDILSVFHQIGLYADPHADHTTTTTLVEAVDGSYRQLTAEGDQMSMELALLVHLLNVSDIPLFPEYMYALADSNQEIAAVEKALTRLEGDVIYTTPDPEDPYDAVHESWSTEFLGHVLDQSAASDVQTRTGSSMTSLFALAEDSERRERVAQHVSTLSGVRVEIERGPEEWVERIGGNLFQSVHSKPRFATLYGNLENITYPDAVSKEVSTEWSLLLGEAHVDGGNLEVARELFERVRSTTVGSSNAFDTAETYRGQALKGLATVADRESEHETARAYLTDAVQTLEETESRGRLARCHLQRASVEQNTANLSQAVEYCEQALTEFRTTQDSLGEGKVLMTLGNVEVDRGDHETAEEHLTSALEIIRGIGSRSNEGICLLNLGALNLETNDLEEAEQYLRQAVEVGRLAGNKYTAAAASTNLGEIKKHRGNLTAAKERFEESLKIYHELGDSRAASVALTSLGIIERKRERYESAVEYQEAAVEHAREVGHSREIGRALANYGSLEVDRENYDAARDRFRESLAELEDLGLEPDASIVRADLAGVDLETGDPEHALERYERALDVLSENGPPEQTLEAIEGAVDVCERLDRPKDVQSWAKRGLELARESNAPEYERPFVERLDDESSVEPVDNNP